MDLFWISVLAFVCELVDSGLGMGYGTILTPILLMYGFAPLQIVPAILVSEFVTGITAAICHHKEGNVNLNHGSSDLKVALILGALSVVGTVGAVILAIKLPQEIVKLWIGIIVSSMGLVILCLKKKFNFSWIKVGAMGLIAAFNKGLSGGGYGPLMTGGQILSGVKTKSAIGITSLAESLVCITGVITYFLLSKKADWHLAPLLAIGAILSVPFAAKILKRIPEHVAKKLVGWSILILGLLTLSKTLLGG